MRILNVNEVAAVSGGATPKPASPVVTVPLALLNGVFTVFNVVFQLPALLTYRS